MADQPRQFGIRVEHFHPVPDVLALWGAVPSKRAIATHPWPEEVIVRVRLGLHTGEPSLTSEGYIGPDVHRAARIMSAAHGGQILLSQTTANLVEQELPDDLMLRDLGEYHLKDLGRHIMLSHADRLTMEALSSLIGSHHFNANPSVGLHLLREDAQSC